jgi:hypothetical protein
MDTLRYYFGLQKQDNTPRQNLLTQIDSVILNIDVEINKYSSTDNKDKEKVNLLLIPYREYFDNLKTKIEGGDNILNDEAELKKYRKQVKLINALIEKIGLVINNVPLLGKELGMEYNENNVESIKSGNEENDYAEARNAMQSQVGGGASKNKSRFSRHVNKKRITKKSSKRGTKRRSHRKH